MVLVIDWGSPNQQWCVDWLHYLHTIVVFFFCTQRVALSNHSSQLGWRMSTLVRVIHSMIIVKCLVIWFTTYWQGDQGELKGEDESWFGLYFGRLVWCNFWLWNDNWDLDGPLVYCAPLKFGLRSLLCCLFEYKAKLFESVEVMMPWFMRRVSWFNNSASKSTYV